MINNRILESKYTIELRYLAEDENFNIFGFDYDFYEPQLKQVFERKFIDHYYFNEIGCETVRRWQHMLRAKLNKIMPYYRQLYHTELEAKKCNFMLNKDLKETFIRDIIATENNINSLNTNTSQSDTGNQNTFNQYKESSINNGNASLSIDSLTTINNEDNKTSSTYNTKVNNNVNGNNNKNNKEKEETSLISQGNIGITSSGQLLEDWRKVLINIDEMLIDECKDLFMLVY